MEALLTDFTLTKGAKTVATYRDLFPKLITTFHDGYQALQLDQTNIRMSKMFYPKWWLEATGYFDNKPNQIDNAILFNSNPTNYASAGEYYVGVLFSGLFVGMVALGVGFVVGKRDSSSFGSGKHAYAPIESHL